MSEEAAKTIEEVQTEYANACGTLGDLLIKQDRITADIEKLRKEIIPELNKQFTEMSKAKEQA